MKDFANDHLSELEQYGEIVEKIKHVSNADEIATLRMNNMNISNTFKNKYSENYRVIDELNLKSIVYVK
ncbi:MAG: hypothetical protein C4617_04185 [Candidatus Liberibacter europaeus]|uniref:Uncharacterized protein n=1 Tax=Candidatus Liberibacter europaeus TaxID=744859 RepID=A0A2T4VX93_9HYPH|nr:hypothetical protein [Candidatus Liberibacter europaeus]PTL86402.1 MAG: hypothetical protein C4617_04185 [Candidatus Liberibacter europaeus]